LEDIYRLLNVGCDKVSVNSAGVKNPDFFDEASFRFGSSTIVAAIDAKKVGENRWNVFINGGRLDTGKDATLWAKEVVSRGAGEILLTSMDADGTKAGFDLGLTKAIRDNVSVPVIASGGAGSKEHFTELFRNTNCDAGLAASIFHFKEIEIKELKSELAKSGVNIRL
jgi:cyclase